MALQSLVNPPVSTGGHVSRETIPRFSSPLDFHRWPDQAISIIKSRTRVFPSGLRVLPNRPGALRNDPGVLKTVTGALRRGSGALQQGIGAFQCDPERVFERFGMPWSHVANTTLPETVGPPFGRRTRTVSGTVILPVGSANTLETGGLPVSFQCGLDVHGRG